MPTEEDKKGLKNGKKTCEICGRPAKQSSVCSTECANIRKELRLYEKSCGKQRHSSTPEAEPSSSITGSFPLRRVLDNSQGVKQGDQQQPTTTKLSQHSFSSPPQNTSAHTNPQPSSATTTRGPNNPPQNDSVDETPAAPASKPCHITIDQGTINFFNTHIIEAPISNRHLKPWESTTRRRVRFKDDEGANK